MIDREEREKHIKKLVRQERLGAIFARAIVKRQRNWIDRLLLRVAMRIAPPKTQPDDFMRDPLIESAPGFTVEELRRFRSGVDR